MSAVADAARVKLAKAREFLDGADLLKDDLHDAAVSLAVSAAINSSDALLLMQVGSYPRGSDHTKAPGLLKGAGFAAAAMRLQRTLSLKNRAQYDPQQCSARDAADAYKNAERLLEEAVTRARARGLLND